jgi:hypothetical protein
MADIKVVIDTVVNDKGLKAAGEGLKSFGATLGLAAGAAYAFNAALDKTQEQLEVVGNVKSAKNIEDAQLAWTRLIDTLSTNDTVTAVIDGISNALKTSADTVRLFSIAFQLMIDDFKFATGQIDAVTSQQNQIAIVKKGMAEYDHKANKSDKENLSTQKDITRELEKQAALQMDSEEAIRKMDARALSKAQNGLKSIGGKIDRLDPNTRANMGISENATRASGNVTVTFKGNDAVAALVQDVIIEGVRER